MGKRGLHLTPRRNQLEKRGQEKFKTNHHSLMVDQVDLMARKHQIYFFFSADFVVLPPLVVFSTDLITPTATVCRMSRTAKRPRGG